MPDEHRSGTHGQTPDRVGCTETAPALATKPRSSQALVDWMVCLVCGPAPVAGECTGLPPARRDA